MTPERLAEIEAAANFGERGSKSPFTVAINELLAEIRRLQRGDFTPEEFQALCHHRDERTGCTPKEFADGCAKYSGQLFGNKSLVVVLSDKDTP